ncbi:MAG: class I SAM-dependent methyltransferase [Polyangiales bacterium]
MNRAEQLLQSNNNYNDAQHLVDVEGMSTPRVCNFLNQLVASMDEDETYLEIGTWKGLTLCSAAYGNAGKKLVACDKFRFYGHHTGWGFKAKRALHDNLARYAPESAEVTFHNMPSEKLFRDKLVPSNVGVYFYDGDHTYLGTRNHIEWAENLLADECILLVDDYNDPEIRRATEDAIDTMNFKATWSKYLPGENGKQDGWWNGLGVFALKRSS